MEVWMPSLTVRTPDGRELKVPLVKPLISIGRSPDNDVVVADPAAPESALFLRIDGKRCVATAQGQPLVVNGKKKDEQALATGDVVTVGASQLVYAEEAGRTAEGTAAEARAASEEVSAEELLALKRLASFSEKLLSRYELDPVLEALLDQVIELTHADKGFLILLEGDERRVKVARNVARETIEDALSRVSDSIVDKVMRERRSLVVSDALHDEEFKTSESVVNLKLSSVMCAPLMEKGEPFGLIYVGNDSVANLFEPHSLDVLNVYAANASLIVRNAMLMNELRLDNVDLRNKLESKNYEEIVAACPAMRDIFRKIDKIAGTDISVLVTGETGVGKELIARAVHRRSPRSGGPFVTINCGAIPENLLESELFGHVKGAFTGAIATRTGKFQSANGGTLFLDEIGEMPLALQVKILRALQEKVIVKVGDSRQEAIDIRVIAATNKVLEDELKKGTFREDLYYRLNVVTLKIPPLRQRGDDLMLLGKSFLERYMKEFGSKAKGFAPGAAIAMKKYSWPGNVRELENRIKKAVVLSDKAFLTAEDLDLHPENLDPILPLTEALENFRKRYIQEVLDRNNGNRTKTAKELDVDPRTIFRHLEKLEAERQGRTLPPETEEAS
jgi:transcriptional regulator with GAF, ATPase, and Fis domain